MTNPLTITLSGIDRTQIIPFRADPNDHASEIVIEATAPGISTLRAVLWDFTNSVSVGDNASVLVTDPSTPGHNAFQGYVLRRKIDIEANYRIISLECTDLNSWLDVKLVGTPDGTSFLQDPPGTYVAFDPNAVTQGSDAATVSWLFTKYAPDLSVDTTTYVQVLAPTLPVGAIRWNTVTLRSALQDLANYVNPAIRFWIDADFKFHWTVQPTSTVVGTAPGPTLRLFPTGISLPISAPRSLTDGPADGITTFNYDSFSVESDDQGWADSVYVNGATGYTFDPTTGKVLAGGSGWVKGIAATGRERLAPISNSDSASARDALGGAILSQASTVVTRISATVTCNFGGWLPGQALSINVTALPSLAAASPWMIQRVVTTFISGAGDRTVALDFGDAPPGTIGLRRNAQARTGTVEAARRPATKVLVTVSNASPGASGVVRVQGQIADQAGNPWPIVGKSVAWTVQVFDATCTDVTATTTYSLSANPTTTNVHGMAWTDLTVSSVTGLTYYVTAVATV